MRAANSKSCVLILCLLTSPAMLLGQGDPDYQLNLSGESGYVGDTANVSLSFDLAGGGILGWSFGVCDDALVSIGAAEIVNGAGTATAFAGSPPEFHSAFAYAGGFTIGAVVSFDGESTLAAGLDLAMYELTYSLLAVGESSIFFCESLGAPPVATLVVAADTTVIEPVLVNGGISIDLEPPPPPAELFRRGDCDGNGAVNALVDALFILAFQFSSGPEPPCNDAADANGDNNVLALVDALYLLSWQFTFGPAPPAPGPLVCGGDDDADVAVDCGTPPAPCAP